MGPAAHAQLVAAGSEGPSGGSQPTQYPERDRHGHPRAGRMLGIVRPRTDQESDQLSPRALSRSTDRHKHNRRRR